MLATLATQVYISVQNDKLSDPYAEQYYLTLNNSQGTPINWTAQAASVGTFDKGLLFGGLSPNTQYTYTLTVTSRSDIPSVSGSFKTSTGSDTVSPGTGTVQFKPKDSFDRIIGITPLEALKTLLVTMTDRVSQAVRRYYFFDIPANILTYFLLDGLEAGRSYSTKWLMFDTSGNIGSADYSFVNFTMPAYDQTPPILTTNTLTAKTDTTAKLHLTTNEQLKKLKVHYRIIGSTAWTEQLLSPTTTSFDVNLSNLISGQSYEYQYTLEDSSGN